MVNRRPPIGCERSEMSRRRWLAFLIVASLPVAVISSTLSTPQAIQDSEASVDGRSISSIQEPESSHEIHCSRERSRAASRIIEVYLMPFVEEERYKLPSKCRLLPENDLYGDQEQHKTHRDINEWQCGYCRKIFYEEKYLDKHFDNRHYNLLNVSHSKCLADLCGALHCDAVMELKQKSRCKTASAARNKHLCESLADNCFPVAAGPSASRLHEFFLRQFCDAHTCNGRQKPFSRGRRKGRSIFWIIISALLLLLLSLLYLFIYLHRRGIKRGVQNLRRVQSNVLKKKPS